jgi:hypothetical protein
MHLDAGQTRGCAALMWTVRCRESSSMPSLAPTARWSSTSATPRCSQASSTRYSVSDSDATPRRRRITLERALPKGWSERQRGHAHDSWRVAEHLSHATGRGVRIDLIARRMGKPSLFRPSNAHLMRELPRSCSGLSRALHSRTGCHEWVSSRSENLTCRHQGGRADERANQS